MKLARVFSDYMILQWEMPICIWGTASKAQTVPVRLNGVEIATAQIPAGDFTIHLPPQEAMEDALLEIGDIRLEHVGIGEVWVAGGQSNMEFMLQYDKDGEQEIAAANDPGLRTYIVGQYSFPGERELGYKAWNPWDRWLPFCPECAKELPAVAIYFAQELRKRGVPVGIVSCNCGGTSAAAWTDRELLATHPELKVYTDEFDAMVAELDMERFQKIRSFVRPAMASPASQKTSQIIMKNTFHPDFLQKAMAGAMRQEARQNPEQTRAVPAGLDLSQISQAELLREGPGDKCEPGSLYTNMVKEIEGYGVRGVIWYQGESDENKAELYSVLFPAMIDCWRNAWKKRNPAQHTLPFLYAQIAPYGIWMNNGSENYPELRRRQEMVADSCPDVYMASISDVGNVYDIHPKEKRPVGHRLALLARKYVYGETALLADAPRAVEARKEGDTLTVHFQNGEGLHIVPGDFSAFNGFSLAEISPEFRPPVLGGVCGLEVLADGKPVSHGECRANGEDLKITGEEIAGAKTLTIRFARTPFYQVNLYNATEIPAFPFELTV